MANRALAAKAERARRQVIEAGHQEYTKSYWIGDGRKATGKAGQRLFASEAVLHHPVVKCTPATASGLWSGKDVGLMGKARRAASKRTYGNGERRKMGVGWDSWSDGAGTQILMVRV